MGATHVIVATLKQPWRGYFFLFSFFNIECILYFVFFFLSHSSFSLFFYVLFSVVRLYPFLIHSPAILCSFPWPQPRSWQAWCKRAATSWQRPFAVWQAAGGPIQTPDWPARHPHHSCARLRFWHVKSIAHPCCPPTTCSDSSKHLIYFQRYAPYLNASMSHSQARLESREVPRNLVRAPFSGVRIHRRPQSCPATTLARSLLAQPLRPRFALLLCSWIRGAILVPLSA